MTNISSLQILEYKNNIYWDFGNKILYELCKKNFKHDQNDIILTKVLFIGRIYAASIERRKNKSKTDINNDDFYINNVAQTFRNSQLDEQLLKLKKLKKLSKENLQDVLEVHHYLMTILYNITVMKNRSFCSKYLHFHLCDLFFIYDSRVVTTLRKFTSRVPKELQYLTQLAKVDSEYAIFFCKCFDLKTKIEKFHNTTLTNRQLDNLLIDFTNQK